MCTTGKVEFPNVRAARTALNRCRTSKRDRRHERSFYLCPHCRSFHLTHFEPHKGQRFT